MGWREWLRRNPEDRQLTAWKTRWREAVAAPNAEHARQLRDELDRMQRPEEEIEIEREMADGLEALVALIDTVASNGLPSVVTGHRVVGGDACHFSAPVSLPEDPAQPSGRLILTNARAIFVGGGRTMNYAWHTVGESVQNDRDVILVRVDRQNAYRFRCNSFADALCGAYIARRLSARGRPV
jgi:hypothetical protein